MSTYFSSRQALKTQCEDWRKQGLTIGFTSGSFDLIHAGHIAYLKLAKEKCDKLIVALNSDSSIKSYKSPKRPINPEDQRLQVIVAIQYVDAVFIFNETNNKENILELKPALYIKAGDYAPSSSIQVESSQTSQTSSQVLAMTSAKYLQEWGGKAITLPFKKGVSTTAIIDKVLSLYDNEIPIRINKKNFQKQKFVFLDRDGVINKEVEYLHQAEQFELLPQVIAGLKKLQLLEYQLVVVTTQAGIGLGYFSKEDFYRVNKKMLKVFNDEQIAISKIYYCPCSKAENCRCRKPETGLFERAITDLEIQPADLQKSFMIGDKTSDILAGKRMNLKTILMQTGHAGKDNEYQVEADYRARDLLVAANWIEQFCQKV